MVKPPVARRHHTVPEFYLKGFADKGQIATVRLPGESRFLQSVSDASVSKDFYALEGHEDGADVIEKALSDIEGTASTVLRSVDGGLWPLGYNDRMNMGYFIALQAARVRSQRETSDHMARQIMRLEIGAGGKQGVRRKLTEHTGSASDEQVEKIWALATRPEGPPVSRAKHQHIQEMIEISRTLTKYIVGRPWLLVEFDRRSLITSDSPVGLIPDAGTKPHEGVGFMTAWGITFPLARKLGLLMASPEAAIDRQIPVEETHHGRFDLRQTGTTQMEKLFNGTTADSAGEWLFHHPEDGKFVPQDLPEPSPVKMSMDSPPEFTGEPWFGKPKTSEPAVSPEDTP